MDDEKNDLIEKLIQDFKESEGKGANRITLMSLKMRLECFTVDELKMISSN